MQEAGFIQLIPTSEVFLYQIAERRHPIRIFLVGDNVPFRVAGTASLVAAPAYILSAEYHCAGRKGVNELLPSHIMIGLSTLIARMGAVEPHLINVSVFGKKLEKLIEKVFVVIVDDEPKAGFIYKRTLRDIARDSAKRSFASVAVEPITLHLVQIGGRKIDS